MNGIRIIQRKIGFNQCISVITAQIFSLLFYAAPAWMCPSLSMKAWKILEGLHYKALRLAIKDYWQRTSRTTVDRQTNRLPPKEYAKFVSCSYAMKIYYSRTPVNLVNSIFLNTYVKSRSPGKIFGYDSSRSRIRRQATRNWIGQNLCQIKDSWTTEIRSRDAIRVLPKKTFY